MRAAVQAPTARRPDNSSAILVALPTYIGAAYSDAMTDLTIDDATLNAAELLLGVRYTDAERAQMRDNLADQIELAVRRRAVKLPNALPPATIFDPRLRSFRMPAQSALNIPRSAHMLPQADEDIAFAPVRHLSTWIAGGQLSCARQAVSGGRVVRVVIEFKARTGSDRARLRVIVRDRRGHLRRRGRSDPPDPAQHRLPIGQPRRANDFDHHVMSDHPHPSG